MSHSPQCACATAHLSLPAPARSFHSCYPLHQGGDYTRFFAPGDAELLDVIRRFQQYDLYSKGDAVIDVDAVWGNYYQALIDEFIPSGDQTKW